MKNKAIAYLIAIILLGSLLRSHGLGEKEYWYDEIYSVRLAMQSVKANVQDIVNNRPPLYQVILHFWIKLFGPGKIATRSLSMIFGVISIYLIYKIGCLLFNRKAGYLSSFFLAISNFHIYYSQEARDYSKLAMLSLLSFLCLIYALKSNKLKYHILYFISLCLLYYSHNYALFVILAQNLYFILRWNKYKAVHNRWLKIQGVAFALYLFWLPCIIMQLKTVKQGFWITKPSFGDLVNSLMTYIDFRPESKILQLLFIILFGALLCLRSNKDPKQAQSKVFSEDILTNPFDKALLLSLWLFLPIIAPFLISKYFLPIYVTKYTIGASCALYLILARGVANLR